MGLLLATMMSSPTASFLLYSYNGDDGKGNPTAYDEVHEAIEQLVDGRPVTALCPGPMTLAL
jgi:hypothetical protein